MFINLKNQSARKGVEIQVCINYDTQEFGGPKKGRSLIVNFFLINVEKTFENLILKNRYNKKAKCLD